jgi:hypothetical protein
VECHSLSVITFTHHSVIEWPTHHIQKETCSSGSVSAEEVQRQHQQMRLQRRSLWTRHGADHPQRASPQCARLAEILLCCRGMRRRACSTRGSRRKAVPKGETRRTAHAGSDTLHSVTASWQFADARTAPMQPFCTCSPAGFGSSALMNDKGILVRTCLFVCLFT